MPTRQRAQRVACRLSACAPSSAYRGRRTHVSMILARWSSTASAQCEAGGDVDTFVGLVQQHGCQVVAFDMDQTIVRAHARGWMRRDEVDTAYIRHVARDFVRVVPALHEAGIGLAIATWSDKLRYAERPAPTYIHGEELAEALLAATVPREAPHFCVFGYNPKLDTVAGHEPRNQAKQRHIRHVARHFEVQARQVMLFDDAPGNIVTTCGYLAFHVNPETAFTLEQAVQQLEAALQL